MLAVADANTYTAEFAIGVLELLALGDRVLGGAFVTPAAGPVLYAANQHAIDVIAGHYNA